ncbi:MAG: M3 family metallopeptidase [Muribaculaceae bacterium]
MAKAQNPFYSEFTGPHATPLFSQITNQNMAEAIDYGIEKARAEVDAIANNPTEATFANTVEALDRCGQDLSRVLGIFFNLLSANADNEMMEISIGASAKLSDYSTSIILNEALWQRVKHVYETVDRATLTPEQQTLLQLCYEQFADNGATLEGADREKYRQLNAELSELTTRFGQNVLKELSTYKIWLTANDLEGLPESSVTAAAEGAAAEGRAGDYLFTLDQPVYSAFLKYSARRDLRERFYRLYCGRNTAGEFNNVEIMARIAEVRRQIANLLGYDTYAASSLRHTMAGSVENVYNLLNQLATASREPLNAELAELSQFAAEYEGHSVDIQPWDYSYYANKLKAAKYSFDEEALRPYFELNNVVKGVFGLATRLYGLQFVPNDNIEVYHPDVKAYDVLDADGSFVGVLYTDFFPRASKRPGAWMTNFAEQTIDAQGVDHRPLVSIVMNFTKPTAETPSLLTPYEVETFLHEFGHALHGLLSHCTYTYTSGTNVRRDFVELPSQFNENYMTEREYLDGFARHYITGEAIPQELVDRLIASQRYGAAYACMRQLNFGFLDMAWHTITGPVADAAAFEVQAIKPVEIFPAVEGTMISPAFSHIFSGGYAAGYYSYKWAEVLDADAFALFKQNGIFDPATAQSFRKNVLERGGSEDPALLYRRFRGQDPTIDALLERDGVKK